MLPKLRLPSLAFLAGTQPEAALLTKPFARDEITSCRKAGELERIRDGPNWLLFIILKASLLLFPPW